jgi:hypothetical protein
MNAGGIDKCLRIFTDTCECRRGGIYIVYKLPSEKPLILNPAGQYIRISKTGQASVMPRPLAV